MFKSTQDALLPERVWDNRIYLFFYRVCTHSIFTGFITFLIIYNTIILALDKFPVNENMDKILEVMNDVLSWLFVVEMIVKLIGLGFKDYAKDNFNIFDCAIVIMSVVENIIGWAGASSATGGAISAFRGVRLLRVFKLARSWTSFRNLLQKIIITLKDIRNFSVLLFLFIFVYTLLGMELFAYRIAFDDDNMPIKSDEIKEAGFKENYFMWYPRGNFNYFWDGFITIFTILIGDGWNEIMYDHMRNMGWVTMIFFISLYIFGNLILLNLFLAILLKNFETEKDLDEDLEKEIPKSPIKRLANSLSIRMATFVTKLT